MNTISKTNWTSKIFICGCLAAKAWRSVFQTWLTYGSLSDKSSILHTLRYSYLSLLYRLQYSYIFPYTPQKYLPLLSYLYLLFTNFNNASILTSDIQAQSFGLHFCDLYSERWKSCCQRSGPYVHGIKEMISSRKSSAKASIIDAFCCISFFTNTISKKKRHCQRHNGPESFCQWNSLDVIFFFFLD